MADHQPDGQTRYTSWSGHQSTHEATSNAPDGEKWLTSRGSLVLLDESLGSRLFRQEENEEEEEEIYNLFVGLTSFIIPVKNNNSTIRKKNLSKKNLFTYNNK